MLKHLTKFLGPAMKHSLAVTISITQRAKFTQPPFLSGRRALSRSPPPNIL